MNRIHRFWLRLNFFIVFVISCTNINSQSFTRITTGDVVNDASYSEGTFWFDINNDGYSDLFVANIINQNNLLFLNNTNSTFTKILTGQIVNDGGFSYGGSFGDFNNDGFTDLYVINGGGSVNQANFLYINNGNSTFNKITTGNIVTDINGSWGSAADDYDNDGEVDIFVSNFNQNNCLYKGNGDGSFTKILTGSIVNDGGASLGAAWCDYDNDGFRDLFVANANFGAGSVNFLYRNNGNGTFTKITTGSIVTDISNSTGGSWADYDNDGDFDLFVTNYSSANNCLYQNNGDGSFTKITSGVIVNDGGSSVGASWGDYDNDGDVDLFVSNDLNENEFLYSNNGNETFTKITSGEIVTSGGRSNGSVWGDYDNDGDIDLYVTNGDQPNVQNNFLFRNNGNQNNWINILCKGVTSNRSAFGTRVIVKAVIGGNTVRQTNLISGQTGYNSQNSLNAEFGLGNASLIDSITVIWPGGLTEGFANVTHNRFITITEGQGISSLVNLGGQIPDRFLLHQNYPNPFNPETNITFEIPTAGFVTLFVYDITGRILTELVHSQLRPGSYEVKWNSGKYSSGVYFYKITSDNRSETRKMILLK